MTQIMQFLLEKHLLEKYFDFMRYKLAQQDLYSHHDVCEEVVKQMRDMPSETQRIIKSDPFFKIMF